jgi:hypothetical protein
MRIVVFILLSISSSLAIGQVPAQIEQAFKKKFSIATNVKWEQENDTVFEASFKLDKVRYSADFSNDGKWIETESTCTYEELPADILSAFEITYPGKSPRHVAMVQTSELKIFFELEIIDGLHQVELRYYPDGKLYHKE